MPLHSRRFLFSYVLDWFLTCVLVVYYKLHNRLRKVFTIFTLVFDKNNTTSWSVFTAIGLLLR